MAVDQQVGDFLEFCAFGEIQDVVTAIMQVVAGTANGTDSGVTGGCTGQRDGFLGFG